MRKKVYTKEELEKLQLVDTTPRKILYTDLVDIKCYKCDNIVNITLTYLKTKKRKQLDILCKDCLSTLYSERNKKRIGSQLSNETKQKIKNSRSVAVEKSKITNQKRYGTDFPSQNPNVKAKQRKTCIDRYGAESRLCSDQKKESWKKSAWTKEARSKRINTIKERYGVEHHSQNEKVKNKIKKSRNKSVRVTTTSKGDAIVDLCKLNNRNVSNAIRVLRRYGEDALYQYCYDNKMSQNNLEKSVSENLKILQYYNKYPLKGFGYRPDFQINNNTFLDIDGLYWHSEKAGKDNNYHINKRKHYEKHGLRIIQIREDEYYYQQDIIISIINNIIGLSSVIYARKCVFQKIDAQTARDFFIRNHLMGYRSSRAFGLYYNGELVCAMSVCIKQDIMEISRFSSKNDIRVQGGFSKLLKHITKEYKVNKIVSFCDMRYATGESYLANGFVQTGETLGWEWTDGMNTYNRMMIRSKMDDRKLSQREYADEKKWYKIYDAGQIKYEKIINNE